MVDPELPRRRGRRPGRGGRPMRPAIIPVFAFVLALALPGVGAAGEAEPDTLSLRSMTPEELFIRASSAELQYRGLLEPARRLLVRRQEESIPYLVTQLDTDQPRERIALENLFVRIGEDAVPALIEALEEEALRDDTTRGARLAAYVLARIGDEAAVRPLIDQSGHGQWKMRSSVADALGHLGGPRAADALVGLLQDDDDSVRKAAAAGLDRIARDGPDVVRRHAEDALLEALDDEFYGVRFAASDALGRLGDELVPQLSRLAAEGAGRTRLLAVRSLGRIGGRDALREIAPYLDDESWTVRAHAAEAVGASGAMTRAARRRLEELAAGDTHPLVVAKAGAALEKSED
ncbi:MAG: hypothetical protein GF405_02355 [Candidatus Eisenbacteria bacterium]|nr:hypothetical protein [Candidatus Eisenbacteria bacterium]